MPGGENEHDLRKIMDMTRLISILLLLLHFYYQCYGEFREWNFYSRLTDKILHNIEHTGIFRSFNGCKWLALALLVVSLLGSSGRKDQEAKLKPLLWLIAVGLSIYFGAGMLLFSSFDDPFRVLSYISLTSTGYLIVMNGGTRLSRIIRRKLNTKDVFNKENETFPQEERLIENEFSLNFPGVYNLKGQERPMFANVLSPQRGLLVCGNPGSGKSRWIVEPAIRQFLSKAYTLFVYDFKYPDLSLLTYNHYLRNKHKYTVEPKFYLINFDDLSRSHRCNPLDPGSMSDITDAMESARSILLGLNKDWARKQGDFWVESSINFLTGIIWFLKRYQHGRYCTLPHAIELMLTNYDKLFPLLGTEPEISAYVKNFISAYKTNTTEQLEGQIGGTQIAIARLSSPTLYYTLTGNDFTLDLNNPKAPKILCLANNPQKQQVYSPVLSLYINRMNKLVNQPGKLKCSKVYDEFPTIIVTNIENIAIERSNKCNTMLVVQDLSQLRKNYGREEADVIMNICGNIMTGQVTGDTAKFFSDQFGKIMQDTESLSINRTDVSVNQSRHLDLAVPPSKIAKLSSGEFVGLVADVPNQPIELKTFHARFVIDSDALEKEKAAYKPIQVVRKVNNREVMRNYEEVKMDVDRIVDDVFKAIIANPSLHHLLLKKKNFPSGPPNP